MLAFEAVNGNEGIFGMSDLKVSQQTTPTSSVKVAPGACAILSRATGAYAQAYQARMPTTDTPINIAATGGAARSDMIVARIEDPGNSGDGGPWPAAGPFISTRVISGVPATATTVAATGWNYTAIPLARIDIPAATSGITAAMITDLRFLANPQSDPQIFTVNSGAVVNLTAASFADWFGSWQVFVPPWAVKAVVWAMVSGARVDRLSTTANGNASGQVRALLGATPTQGTAYDFDVVPSAIISRFTLGLGDTLTVPTAARGTTSTLKLQGYKSSGNQSLYADTATSAVVSVQFKAAAA